MIPQTADQAAIKAILDGFAGHIVQGDEEPAAVSTEDDGIAVTAFLRGGGGTLRAGPRRRLIVRVEMPPGLHIYDEPVPSGMVPTSITLDGPDGLRHSPARTPATTTLTRPGVPDPLHVWDGTIDFVMDVWGDSTIGAEIAEGAFAFSCHRFFMENPSLSGRGSAGAEDVPKLAHAAE